MAPPRPPSIVTRAAAGRAKKIRRQGQALDHKNRKAPISKPAANAQRPNVQAETTRTRLRRSCGISSDRSVITVAPLRSNCWGRPLWAGQYPAMDSSYILSLVLSARLPTLRPPQTDSCRGIAMSGSMPTPPALFSLAALRVPALREAILLTLLDYDQQGRVLDRQSCSPPLHFVHHRPDLGI